MRILLFINRICNRGGSERAAVTLANQLSEEGHEVILLSWMGGRNSFFKINDKVKVDALFDSDVNIYKDYIRTLYRYYKYCAVAEPELVIDVCTALSLLSVPLKAVFKFKLISWEHFNTSLNWNAITPRLSRWLASKFANVVVTLTEFDRNQFINRYHAHNAVCIANPLTIFPDKRSNLNSKQVLSVGRLTHQKGFDLLIQSWKIVAEHCPDWRLVIVGDGELKSKLVQQIFELELNSCVSIHETTQAINEYYASSSLYVLSSRFEGLPFVLIEAKAFGLPIISFNCKTGPSEIVRHGVDGVLIEPENINQLADAVIELINDESRRLKFASMAVQDITKFDIRNIVKQWSALIADL